MARNNNPLFALILFIALGLLGTNRVFGDQGECCQALSPESDVYTCPDRVLALLLPQPIPEKSFLLTIEHRAFSPAFEHPFRDGFGLDNGLLKIGVGLRYSPTAGLDIGVRRGNNVLENFDTYEADARFRFWDGARKAVDAAAVAGMTWFAQDTGGDASGFYGGLLLGRSLGDIFYVSSGLLLHSSSTYPGKSDTASAMSMALPAGAAIRIIKGGSLVGETFIPVAGYGAGHPSYAVGFKFATWRHSFSILFTNTQYTTFDGIVAGSHHLSQPSLGFLITRKFGGSN